MSTPSQCPSPTTELTLAKHAQSRITELTSCPPFPLHSCSHCSKLFVRLSTSIDTARLAAPVRLFDQNFVDFPIYGLTEPTFQPALESDCPLFSDIEPEDYKRIFDVSEIGTVVERNFCLRIRLVGTQGLTILRATPVAYGNDDRSLGPDGLRYPHCERDILRDIASPWPEWIPYAWEGSFSAATDASFKQMKSWLSECFDSESTHCQCILPPMDFVPTRLLEIPRTDTAASLRIVETQGLYRPWCSLSYCWGGPQLMQTTTVNFLNGSRTISLSDLPATILDAVLVARKLRSQYLWVDSLCIIQDDPKDLVKELASMPAIYSNSTLTISAASSSDCNAGFLGPQVPRATSAWSRPIRLRFEDERGQEGHIIISRVSIPVFPIHSRAWALQEHLLPPRILTYGPMDTIYLCNSGRKSYSNSLGARYGPRSSDFYSDFSRRISSPDLDEGKAVTLWLEIIYRYCVRELGFKQDRPVALSAVAQAMGQRMNWNYVAGLWKQNIERQLGWYTHQNSSTLRRSRSYRAPSWSWASLDGTASLDVLPAASEDTRVFPSIVNVVFEPAQSDLPYGDAKLAYLTTHCVSVNGVLSSDPERPGNFQVVFASKDSPSTANEGSKPFWTAHLDAFEDDFPEWDEKFGCEVHLLPFKQGGGPSHSLIVKKLAGLEQRCQRVGMLMVLHVREKARFEEALMGLESSTFVIA